LARVVSVVDAFDALTTDRPYRTRMTVGEAMTVLSRESGRQFDPEILGAFLSMQPETAVNQ
jgi:HD-GYP domain-containing protein (c-di-GMP phosphodiesterase class II)